MAFFYSSRPSGLTRRHFLGCASAAALALPAQLAAAGDSPPRRALACRLASYGAYEEAAWTHLPAIGVRHMFMNVPEPDQIDAVAARLEAHKLAPVVMRGAADLSTPESIGILAGQLAICRRFGVRYMFLSPKHAEAPREVAWEHLRRAGDAAAEQDVIIALETHPDLGTNGAVHLETMQAVDHPYVRVNFDTGNITYYNRDTDAVSELKKIVDYVATVEFKDHNGGFETWTFPPLGQGVVDFPGVLDVLNAHGYAGPITLEFEGTKGVELDEAQTRQAIETSVAYVRSLGEFD
ncbi:MAG: sugar phosphate isomerase/epimerase [Candidatus Hydrogenedentes bacterium]|nr:sugar phosphate isomerase/epimerase [Candidatus Hydrogenedentota bacterium]